MIDFDQEKRIGTIQNYYGGVFVKKTKDASGIKYWWSVEDWNDIEWEEIPRDLFHELLNFEKERPRSETENDEWFETK